MTRFVGAARVSGPLLDGVASGRVLTWCPRVPDHPRDERRRSDDDWRRSKKLHETAVPLNSKHREHEGRPSMSNPAGGTLQTKCARHRHTVRTVLRRPRAVRENGTRAGHGRRPMDALRRHPELGYRASSTATPTPADTTTTYMSRGGTNDVRGRRTARDKCPAQWDTGREHSRAGTDMPPPERNQAA